MKTLLACLACALCATSCALQPETPLAEKSDREYRTGSNIARERASVARTVIDRRQDFDLHRDQILPAETIKVGN